MGKYGVASRGSDLYSKKRFCKASPSLNTTARSVIQGTSDSTEQAVIISIPGSLIEQINPEPTFIHLCKDINTDDFSEIKGGQTTWQVSADTLQAACDLLWAKAIEMKVPLKSITSVNPSDPKNFPYRLSDSSPAIISVEASALLAASRGERLTVCPLCEANVSDMHCHMGLHILQASTNTPEEKNLKKSHTFRYGSAETGSKNKPCRNIPLKCELCHPTLPPQPGKTSRRAQAVAVNAIWCYNMTEHILSEHEEYAVPGHKEAGVGLPANVLKAIKLTELEQMAACIPMDRNKENIPASTSCPSKRSALESAASMPAKRAHTAAKPMLTAHTLVV
ncbi:hypothetical protein F4604DRAFT_1931509 [Suillus subluteus]|nr:hypothetical protein F4604DRAFT_1931509 [Suillus subluteus]